MKTVICLPRVSMGEWEDKVRVAEGHPKATSHFSSLNLSAHTLLGLQTPAAASKYSDF
jgi:hypothetical protein